MTTPEAHAALAAALAAVQAELPEVKKTRTAEVEKDGRFLYSYAYADLSHASAAILPILGKHGLAFTAFPGHQPDGKFGLRYWLLHKDGGSIEGFFEIGEQGGMQMVGGRITYARRYCLCAVTGVAAEEDVDARDDGSSGGRRMQRRPQPAGDMGQQQPRGTAQRRARAPAPARQQPQPDDAVPPLPGDEDEVPTSGGAATSATAPPNGGASGTASGSPDEPVTNRQLTAIWTALTRDFAFTDDEKDMARAACGSLSGRGSGLPSTKELTKHDAETVIDALGQLKAQAKTEGEHPRSLLIALLAEREEGEVPDGE